MTALLAAALGGLTLCAHAQDYPVRPVTIVVPYAAGGGTDILGRLVAQHLEERLGRSFVIENRPGAGGTTGAGHIPLTFIDFGPSIGMLRAGKVRSLGISTEVRLAQFPDIPPIAQSGVPGFDAASWQMIAAPAGTPPPIVDKLHAELVSAVAAAEFQAQIIDGGMLPMNNPPVNALQHFVKSEIMRWGEVVRRAGLAGSE